MEDWVEDDWMEWLETTFEALDAKDVDAFVGQLTPGAELRYGNGAPLAGRVAIRDAFTEFFGTIESVSHAFTSQLRVDDTLVIEQMVTFTRRNGSVVMLPSCSVFDLTEGKADRVQTYVDVSPVFAGGDVPALCRAGEAVMA
ncbi:MAG TPA: nuclear transport factor 2 family protein [Gemmatimonadaceae bacterium]|nr:nuclear transport factor 2 family protein [Gemmatimonadaceae bacterium]